MDKRVAQNGLNLILSERMNFSGADFIPLAEFVRELQTEIQHGTAQDPQSGNHTEPPPGP